MFTSLAAILAIIATWLLYTFACLGLGAWYLLAFRKNNPTRDDIIATFWIGLATLLAFLQLWHFLAPINLTAHVTLLALGALGVIAILRPLLRALPPLHSLLTIPNFLFLLTLLWLANRATGPGAEYDAGLYHIPAINWTKNFAIVPGLANLHLRLGFSSTLTLLAALMDQGLWIGHANHLLNSFFLAALAATTFRSVTVILKSPSDHVPHHWLLVFSALLITDWARDVQASSYSTDIGAVVLTVIAAHYFLQRGTGILPASSSLLTITLAAAAITAKASTLILCAPMILLALLAALQIQNQKSKIKNLLPSLIAATLLIGPWLIRQTILTGYPLYPLELLALPVDWKMPHEKVRWLRRIMLDWARWYSYNDSRQTLAWIPKWLHIRIVPSTNLWKTLLPALITILALPVALILRITTKPPTSPQIENRKSKIKNPATLLLALTLLAALAWFLSAPDPRYASQIFILMMAASLIIALAPLLSIQNQKSKIKNRILLAALLLALAPNLTASPATQFCTAQTILGFWILPPATGLFHPTPTADITAITTPNGLKIYIANPTPTVSGGIEDRVWNAPLPNAPYSEITPREVSIPPLRLRDPTGGGDMQKGFTRAPDFPPFASLLLSFPSCLGDQFPSSSICANL